MKKLLFLFCLCLNSLSSMAFSFMVDGISYETTSSTTVAVSRCQYTSHVTIPKMVTYENKNYDVTSIGEGAFAYSKDLASVTIPNSVTSIGSEAFYLCASLTSVDIPNSVTIIGEGAFDGCSGLTSITIPNSVTTIGGWVFSGCHGLTSVTIPNSVTSIGERAFEDCTSLPSITIPDGVTSIDNNAFENCTSLTFVSISESVTTIGDCAFKNCYGLTSVDIPNSVTSIGSHSFDLCGNLTSIFIGSGVTFIGNGAFNECHNLTKVEFTSIESMLNINCDKPGNPNFPWSYHLYINGEEVTQLVIPNSIIKIARNTFYGCSYLTSVSIPNSVISIGNWAFRYCGDLVSINIPNSVTFIGSCAFMDCWSLTTITIPNSVTEIQDYAFGNCDKLRRVVVDIKEPLTIEENTFTNRFNATLYVPKGCINAYSNAEYWKDFKVIKEIGHDEDIMVFEDPKVKAICVQNWDVNGDEEISFEEARQVKSLGGAFQRSEITTFNELEFFVGLTSIDENAFWGCNSLTTLTIPNSVTEIGNSAFYGCSGLSSITIPYGVTSIGNSAFYYCTALISVTIPESVSSMGSGVFQNCTGLTSVRLPNGLRSISNSMFENCYALTSITIPDNVTTIGGLAFWDCRALTAIDIPESVTTIESSAFAYCKGLTSITIPKNITKLDISVFASCNSLSFVFIPNNITTLEGYTFSGCSGLKLAVIPSSVTYIGFGAFYNCNNLTRVFVDKEVPLSIEENTFTNRQNAILFVPNGSREAYSKAAYWKEFKKIIEFGIDEMEEDGSFPVIAFADSIVRELCVKNFDDNGDKQISKIDAAIVDDLGGVFTGKIGIKLFEELRYFVGLTTIRRRAFDGCSNLTSVSIPHSVKNVAVYAFANCTSLSKVYCHATNVPTAPEKAFESTPIENATLYVPEASIEAYKTTAPWSRFGKIVSLTDDEVGIKQIDGEQGTTDNAPQSIYDLSGRKLQNIQRGMNILRMNDGTTIKVLKK